MRLIVSFALVCSVILLYGCGGSAGGTVAGTIDFLNGATSGSSQRPALRKKSVRPSNGNWLVTPNKAKVKITAISFSSATEEGDATLVDGSCEVTFDFAASALSEALDCDILYPEGTFNEIQLEVSTTDSQVLIDDAVNGIYTNSSDSNKVTTTDPGDPSFVALPHWNSSQSATENVTGRLATPVTITAGSPPTLVVTGDLSHTVLMDVSGGVPSFNQSFDNQGIPVAMSVSVGTPGGVAFYSSYNTALSVNASAGGPHGEVRVYYDSANTPFYLFLESGNIGGGTSGCGGGSYPSGAYSSKPSDTNSAGGYLGRDSSNVIAWARPTDQDFSTYVGVFALDEKTTLGQSTTLRCKNVTSDPVPTSGDTYSSGAPSTASPDATATVKLVQKSF